MKKSYYFSTVIIAVLLAIGGSKSYAQLKGVHLLGDNGLNAGTQPAPSVVVAVPLYWYDTKDLYNGSGDKVSTSPNVTTFLTGIGGSLVTPWKILNANYGASLLVSLVKNNIEGSKINENGSIAFSDIYVQPIQLGWHTKKADFTAGYALYIPSGKFSAGADDNSGLGMWGHEFSAGTTFYFDKAKTFNLSTTAYYELHSKKRGTDDKVGNILTLEGGLNKSFMKPLSNSALIFNVGAIYYMQFKMTNDDIWYSGQLIDQPKDHIYAAGLEANVFWTKSMTSLSFRWLDEFSAKNRYEGNTFFVTLSQVIKTLGKK